MDCNPQAVYLIIRKHETVKDNTIIILMAFRVQQIGLQNEMLTLKKLLTLR